MSLKLFIIGMQKSGTSLLNRILMSQDFIENPFLPEGKHFWGDNPPFEPKDKPCGEVYQKHAGKNGHFMNADDFHLVQKLLLQNRINQSKVNTPILMNKNPYNSVRIKWLKSVFPKCKIIALYRNPVSNVYSLLKKYQNIHEQNSWLDKDWWGVKPKNWMDLISEDKLLQCCNQWNAVNQELIDNSSDLDYLWNYENICNNPNSMIMKAQNLFNLSYEINSIPKLKNFDKEYLVGSRLTSKNKELRKQSEFDLSSLKEDNEFPAFTRNDVDQISSICSSTYKKLSTLKN